MKFSFITPQNISFEQGAHKRMGALVSGMGHRALLLHGNSMKNEIRVAIEGSLNSSGIESIEHIVPSGEPEAGNVDDAAEKYIAGKCDFIIAIGGGSIIDTGKAASGIIPNGGELKDYLEGVGTGKRIINDPVPFVAVPTTHGTGAEATKNAVISSKTELYKKSIRDDRLLPDKVIIDAQLMLTLPKRHTAYCSMDALTQLIEAYTSIKANPMTDALCLSGLKAISNGIYGAYDNGEDVTAREQMAYASLLSGICLANAGLGAVHGVAPALGITCGISHGESCAIMLDHIMELNMPYSAKKYADIGRVLTGTDSNDDAYMANKAVKYVRDLKAHMGVPDDLRYLNIKVSDIDVILSRCSSNSMNANPVKIEKNTLSELIKDLI